MITLVKTTGGSSGTPDKCACGSIDFIRSGIAWACSECHSYVPPTLSKGVAPIESLKRDIEALKTYQVKLKEMIKELEETI